jgi:hypothetical protein
MGRRRRGDAPKGNPGSNHWARRAEEYRQLALACRNPEVHQVLVHLARVCIDMAGATESAAQPAWIQTAQIGREGSATAWHEREVQYRAMAAACDSKEDRNGWLAIADRCAALADHLEKPGQNGARE